MPDMQAVSTGPALVDKPTMVLAHPIDLPTETRCLTLHRHPTTGVFGRSDFKMETRPLPLLAEGRVFCRTLAISMDPNMRPMTGGSSHRHDDADSEIKIGDIMYCLAAAVVIASRDEKCPVGTYGYVHYGACEYGVASRMDRSFEPFAVQPRTRNDLFRYLSVYSYIIGLTAYHSVFKILEVQKSGRNAVVVVSGARGAVGSLVGQMCKMLGAIVIGICGSDEKVEELKKMGFDTAFNYKSENIQDKLRELAPMGISHYHDNVGGDCTSAILPCMAVYGRISVCGCISEYTKGMKNVAVKNWQEMLTKRLLVQGFVSSDHLSEMEEFHRFIVPKIESGQIRYDVDVREGGLEHFGETANDLFKGRNHGKLILQLQKIDLATQG